jgi:DNA-binding FadR family transcriptional regulator
MPLQTIEPRRLYRQIADQLRALIQSGEYPIGCRLPAERDLAATLGVSRPSVREALIALEVEGLVEVRMGSGIYVQPPEAASAARRVVAEAPLETIRARQVIESELAAQAALQMKPAQVRGLRDAIAAMEEEAAAGQVPTHGDRLFHLRIAEASDNSVLLRVVGELFDERRNPLFAQLGSHFETADSWAAAIAEHRAVVAAIAAHAPERAREAMRRHLSNSHDRFTDNWPASSGKPAKHRGASA